MVSNRRYAIREDDMNALADGVRWRISAPGKMDIASMVEKMKQDYFIKVTAHDHSGWDDTPWTRPNDWPDLDILNLEMSGDDFIYMTYDANREASAIAWYVETVDKQPAILDIGHIENGTYIVDETHEMPNNKNFIQWTDDLNGYLVLRVTGQLKRFYTAAATRDGQTQHFRQQPVLERIAWVPNLIYFAYAATSGAWGLWSLEHDVVANGSGKAITNTANMYVECARLSSLDMSGVHAPKNTSMSSMFSGCHMLRPSIDLRNLDVSKVTRFNSMFNNCCMLTDIDLTGWNTGTATTFGNMFSDCRRLERIRGIETFDTSSGTDFSNMFSGCYSLPAVDVGAFDTSNATTFSGMFTNCTSLIELDLSGWNVNKVTNLSSVFSNCRSLKRADMTGWSTGVLTSIMSVFNTCYNLQHIDVSGWNVTSACTNIASLFNGCWSVRGIQERLTILRSEPVIPFKEYRHLWERLKCLKSKR